MRSLLPSLLLSCLLAIVSPQWSAAYAQGIESLRTAVEQEGAVFTSNNSVVFFSSGADKFRDLFQAVHEARQTIHMEYFNFRDDSIANTLFDSLAVKARQGVKVRLLYDDFGNKSNNQPIRPKRLQEIRDMGIELYVFDPIKFPWLNHIIPRDHRKIVVIDGKSAYPSLAGGMTSTIASRAMPWENTRRYSSAPGAGPPVRTSAAPSSIPASRYPRTNCLISLKTRRLRQGKRPLPSSTASPARHPRLSVALSYIASTMPSSAYCLSTPISPSATPS